MGAPHADDLIGRAPTQRASSQEIAALVPGAKVVEGVRLPHSAEQPEVKAIPREMRVGAEVIAPIAPPTGDIVQAPETWVAVAVKTFWTSATIIWLRRLVIGAFGGAFVIALEPYVAGDKAWATFTITGVLPIFERAFEIAVLSAVFAYFKTRDNNVIGTKGP